MHQITFEQAIKNIEQKVTKTAFNRQKGNNIMPKPFKSGNLVNTVKDVIMHPALNIPAYTFVEDSTYVECRRCDVVDDAFKQTKIWQEINQKLNGNVITVVGDTHNNLMAPEAIEAFIAKNGVVRPDGEF